MMRCSALLVAAVVAVLGVASSAAATPIPVGVLSFDTLLPGPGGTSAFFLSNLTGDPATGGFALPPDFPVATELVFASPALMWSGSTGGTHNFGGGPILPGPLDPDFALQFPDTAAIVSATFTAILSPTTVALTDGRLFRFTTTSLHAVLAGPSGGMLAAGDFVVLSADAEELVLAEPVPEPSTLALLVTGLVLWSCRGRLARFSN